MYTVGYIDVEKYRNVSSEIRTREVIITEERIRHIQERHPNDYERFCAYMPEMIQDPDYIIMANKANTAVILKEVVENGEKFKLILRIKTPDMPEDYKNSVISFWCIGDTTWKKTLKNKKILYKKNNAAIIDIEIGKMAFEVKSASSYAACRKATGKRDAGSDAPAKAISFSK